MTTTDTLTAAGFTPAAVRQAAAAANAHARSARLHAIAAHIAAHPGLAPAIVHLDDVQIATRDHDDTPALLAWARSLTRRALNARNINGNAYVYATGRLDNGHDITVWAVLGDHPDAVDQLGIHDGPALPVSMAALAQLGCTQ